MQSIDKNYVLIFLAGVIWGSIGLFVKLMESFGSTVYFTSFARMVCALVIMIPIALIFEGPKAFLLDRRTLFATVLMGFFCQSLYNIFYSLAIHSIGMSLSAVLLYTSPFFTSMMSFAFLGEKVVWRKCVAMVINIAGCALAITGNHFSLSGISLAGVIFGVGAGFCYALSPVLGRVVSQRGTPFTICVYNFFFAAVFLALFTHPWTTLTGPVRWQLILTGFLYGLLPTVCSYILYYKGLARIKEVSKVPVFASVETVSALVIGIIVFRESLGIVNIGGVLLVFLSMFIMNMSDALVGKLLRLKFPRKSSLKEEKSRA